MQLQFNRDQQESVCRRPSVHTNKSRPKLQHNMGCFYYSTELNCDLQCCCSLFSKFQGRKWICPRALVRCRSL